MPIFTLSTNVAKEKIPADFLHTTAKLIADLLGKPISYVVVHVQPDQMISWAGSQDACASASLHSIGALGETQNIGISKALFAHVKSNLGVNSDRMYINFTDLKRHNVGYMGSTFAAL